MQGPIAEVFYVYEWFNSCIACHEAIRLNSDKQHWPDSSKTRLWGFCRI